MNSDIRQGQEAEQQICHYVDSLVSTFNPLHPDAEQWTRPVVHPSKNGFLKSVTQNGNKTIMTY